jgi:hypothetical protein
MFRRFGSVSVLKTLGSNNSYGNRLCLKHHSITVHTMVKHFYISSILEIMNKGKLLLLSTHVDQKQAICTKTYMQ